MAGEVVSTLGGQVTPVTVAINTATSSEFFIYGSRVYAIEMPTTWTESSTITFQGSSSSGGTFRNIYKSDGTEFAVTATQNVMIVLDTNSINLAPFTHLKLRSGSSATPVNQAAARTVYIISK